MGVVTVVCPFWTLFYSSCVPRAASVWPRYSLIALNNKTKIDTPRAAINTSRKWTYLEYIADPSNLKHVPQTKWILVQRGSNNDDLHPTTSCASDTAQHLTKANFETSVHAPKSNNTNGKT